jgi:Tol biopolymer transport system component
VNGILQIHTRKPGSADSTQHTRHDFDCLAPFWSNDGTRLYYTTLDFGSRAEIWTVAVAGGEPQRLLEQAVFGALSSDSKTLAFVRCLSGESGCGVWLSSPPGAPPKRFPREPLASRQGFRHHFWMDFAPSGGLLGILTAPTGAAEFYLASQDGESCRLEWSLRRRVRTAAGISFSWLPDSSAVLMTERLGAGSASLDLVRSGRLSTLHRGEQSFLHPTVSPDGGKVCYTTANSGYDVYEVPVDGSPMRPLVATGFDERSPAWSPDGRQIAYGTSDAIHLHDRQAGTDRTLLSLGDPVSVMDLAFSPDGQRLAFRRLLPPDLAIYITNLAGDTPVPLWKDPDLSPQRGPVWSPDGRWIAYYGFRDGNSAIFKIRVGGNEKPVFLTAGTANRPLRWSPRGDWLACDVITGLNLVSPDGKQLRKVSDRHWETFGFSSDGRNLIGIRVSDTRRLLLASVDVSTGQEKVLGDLGPRPASFTTARILAELPFRGFSLAPDGKSFVTSVYRDNSDLWIMKGIDQHLSLWQKLWPWR